ncbi:UNVERIFIED_CONTAM: hypothetical protein Sradi_1829800 [Sesamum radiatum]|uniref:Uncharacterized protein n=1 Tax=Sesamum radiatum TaxID=300843 RepID=A0AAW2TW98_SESRA
MSLWTLKPVACRIPPVTGANGSHSKVAMVNRQAPSHLQVQLATFSPTDDHDPLV